MGAIWFKQSDLVDKVVEYVGFKSGLAVTKEQLAPHIPDEHKDAWDAGPDEVIRIRSEVFEELIADTLYNLGVPDPGKIPFFAPLAAISQRDPAFAKMFADLEAALPGFRKSQRADDWDLGALLSYANEKYGATGSELAIEMAFNPKALTGGAWGVYREIAWQDIRELDELFTSENLNTFHGKYFDQRFVDYLTENDGDIGKIQWRQFEGLTAEYFVREGYKVEIGPGRDDGNIDVRAWADGNVGPPTILIQCKRQKKKIDKLVVKGLYADMLDEKAESGMIVTTSTLSPGAAKLVTARGYPIEEVNRGRVLKWVKAMRSGKV